MTKYKCERCLCTFDRKSSYDNHNNRQTKCRIVKHVEECADLQLIMIEMDKRTRQ